MERNGNLICQVVPNTQRKTIEPIVKANIKEGATVYTDEWFAYDKLYKYFNHQRVNHSAKQYVKEKASTNSIENAWSHLKGGIRGTYHWISRKHTQKYLDEFTMRYNTRKYDEEDRFNLVLSSVAGKRLTYRELISHY
jgi:transposase-like protein